MTITVKDVLDAIEKNGLIHLHSKWDSYDDGKMVGGCAITQGAFNLGIGESARTLYDALNSVRVNVPFGSTPNAMVSGETGLGYFIVNLNDTTKTLPNREISVDIEKLVEFYKDDANYRTIPEIVALVNSIVTPETLAETVSI